MHSDELLESADLEDGMTSPSKSFRRRLRRKRQAEAVKAAAATESITYAEADSRSCQSQVVTLEDLGFGLLRSCGGFVDAKLTLQSPLPTPMNGIHHSGTMNAMVSPQACQASFSTGSVEHGPTTPLDKCLPPMSPCIVSTHPCLGTVVRGDASCRSPVGASGPTAAPSMIVVANPVPIHGCTTLHVPPLYSPTVGPAADALRFLCGGSTPVSAEDLAQRLQAAAPDVYED